MEKRKIPFRALGGVIEKDDVDAAVQVMHQAMGDGGNFFPLPEENDLQRALAEHEGGTHAVVVNSCGTALDLCMMALGIDSEEEVITTGLSFICSATCAAARGAKIVFADVDPETLCLDPAAVEKRITPQTRAIVAVHFAGHPCDVEGFARLGKKYEIPIIYDSAHAVSTKYHGVPVGKWGLASCYSFQSNKNMTTLGEGGAIVTSDAEFAEQIRRTKTFGYVYGAQLRIPDIGFNYRMTKVQAAVGLTQLAKVDRVIHSRRERFIKLVELLGDIEEIKCPPGVNEDHACHLFVIQLLAERINGGRDAFRDVLKRDYGIDTAVHYPAIWEWEAAQRFAHDRDGCDHTERICKSVISLPVFGNTPVEDLEYIAWAIKDAIVQSNGNWLSAQSVAGSSDNPLMP